MSRSLRIASNLSLPLDFLTMSTAIVGIRGSGKTNTAVDIAEEAIGAGIPIVVVDPTGVWSGLKSSRSGKEAGLPVYVFGGENADVPLEPTAGAVIAKFAVEQRVPIILDLKLLRKGQQVQLVTDFAETLFHINREPLPVFLDEVARFCPQMVRPELARCVGAIEDLATLGRSRGLGPVLIGQRAAMINKNVLTQCDTLICMRLVAPQDRKAIDEWVNLHGDKEQRDVMMGELAKLRQGHGFIWSPAADIFQKVAFRERHTFDSSRTPKIGERVVAPKVFASVDVGKLTADIAATVERAKADDPKALRAKIAELTKQLASAKPTIETKVERVEVLLEVPYLPLTFATALSALGDKHANEIRATVDAEIARLKSGSALENARRVTAAKGTNRPHGQAPRVLENRAKTGKSQENPGSAALGKAERAFLTVMAQRPNGVDRDELGLLAGYSPSSGHINNTIGALRTAGYVEQGWPVRITDAGSNALGSFDLLPEGQALVDYWLNHPRLGKAHRAFLAALVDAGPAGLDREQLAERTGYESTSGHINNTIGALRTMKLVTRGWPAKASEVLL
jgi:hypothetical protein